jgi:chromate reductase
MSEEGSMDNLINILGFAGSLRKGSYNRALLRVAVTLVPEGARLETYDLKDIPIFNNDLVENMPVIVREFKSKIKAADAILIVTPEYNYSIPGVLKNAIDWASRPMKENAFNGKPVAMMSASTGMLGGARAQYHLRQSFVTLNMRPLNKPEIFVAFAEQKFDEQGNLIDEKTKDLIKSLLEALVTWTRQLGSLPQH